MSKPQKKSRIKYPYEYSPKIRKIAKGYTKIRLINGILNGILVPLVFVYILLVTGLSARISGFSAVPIYVFVFLSLLEAVQFPLRFYSGYVLEHKHGLSNQNLRAWFKDYFKSLFLSYILTIPVITGLYYLLPLQQWWLYAGIAYFFLIVTMNYIFPVLVFPFFYKIEPYKDAKMKEKLIKMAARFHKRIDNVFVAKESEKSNKANAMFVGIGKTKRIILFDTLLNSFTKDEVETVIGHELGHYVNRDDLRFIAIDALRIFPVLLLIDFVLKSSIGSFGITAMDDIASLPLFVLIYYVIDLLLSPLVNTYSRHRETKADLFGLEVCKKPEAQISTEKRLADTALADDSPNPLVEFFLFSHPAPAKRIKMVEDWEKK